MINNDTLSLNNNFKNLGFPSKEMWQFPNIINLEIFRGECQCGCVHCPVGATNFSERKNRFGIAHMDYSLYEKIITEMEHYPHSTLRFHSVGEPLLWNSIKDALLLAMNKNIKTWVFTNALTKNKSLLETLCKCSKLIEISINSTNAEDYRRTKGVNGFDQVVSNINWMRDLTIQKGYSTRIIVSRVESEDKELDQEFISYWKDSNYVDDAIVRSYHTYNGLIDDDDDDNHANKRKPCLVHWGRFNIGIDGNAVICFNELFKNSIDAASMLGNITDQTIKEIWQGNKLNKIRKAELLQDYGICEDWKKLPCKDCTSCQPLEGERDSSEYQINFLSDKAC